MSDKTRRDDFDKKLDLPNIMKNRVHREMKLGDITRFMYFMLPPVPKTQKQKKQTNKKLLIAS